VVNATETDAAKVKKSRKGQSSIPEAPEREEKTVLEDHQI
jgi:hypothetical protein